MAEITRAKARTIITKAFAHGKDKGMRPLAVIVLDAGGHTRAYERDDGAAPGRYPIAEGKAYGALMMGVGGTALNKLASDRLHFGNALAAAYGGKFIPVPGGVLVRDKRGAIIGAVGVSGDTSENDAAAALAGIEAAGFTGEA